MTIRVGIGQDSHRFEPAGSPKPLTLGGIVFPGSPGLQGNSDADVVLHALANAISSVTGVNVIGAMSDEMCRRGITDSREYLRRALEPLGRGTIQHVAVAIECREPRIAPRVEDLRASIAALARVSVGDVGVTATSGEGLTAFGRGEGIQALCVVTVETQP